jgi:ATP/maltotriose-dependent transcriptional regulator MalT
MDEDTWNSGVPEEKGSREERGEVRRRRLLTRLTAAMDEPWTLTLVTAPAGAGKTRLLLHWADEVGADPGTDVVWLALRRGDTDLAPLRAALEQVDDEGLRTSLARAATAPVPDDARSLARALRASTRRIVVILDDIHHVEDRALADDLSAFASAVPGNAHVVMSGRGTGLVRVARRRIAGIALALDNHDLAFTPAEVRSFFGTRGVRLSQGEVSAILQRTEGWATGLQLMAVAALEDRKAIDRPLHGNAPAVVDYFAEEVFAELDEDLVEFLLTTAVPEEFTLDLAHTLSGGAPAGGMVERLTRLNALIERTGEDPVRYHYHPLLREFLLARLEDRGPRAVGELQKTAAEWFATRQEHLSALRHAMRSGDAVCVSVVLRRCGMQLILMGHADDVLDAAAGMGPSVRTEPTVQMLIAAAELARGDESAAAAVLARLRDAEASAVTRHWQAGLDLHTAVRRGGIAEALARLSVALDAATGEPQLDTYASLQAAMGELYVGRLDRAERLARFAADQARTTGMGAAELQANAILNTSTLFRGRMREVLESGARLDERWGELGEPDSTFYQVSRVWRYWVPFERMDSAVSTEILAAATAVIGSGTEHAIARGLQGMIALRDADAAADPRLAAVTLRDNLTPREDLPLPAHWYAMVSPFAVHAFDRLDEPVMRDRFIADTERALGATGDVAVLHAIAALHDHRPDAARAALAVVLDGTAVPLVAASMVDAWLVSAVLDVEAGDTEQAQVSLSMALVLAEPEEHVRRIAEAGPVVARLLAARATTGARSRFADRVRERLAAEGVLVEEELTRRERIVLAALSRNATLRQIAQQEFISPNTVKTHVRNIYRKLGVSDRDSVTAAAHALGIE